MEDSIEDSQFNKNLLSCSQSHTADRRKGHRLAGGEFPHISVDMMLGLDIPHFRKLLKEALEEESSMKLKTNSLSEEAKEETRIQEREEPVIHSVDLNHQMVKEKKKHAQLDKVDPS